MTLFDVAIREVFRPLTEEGVKFCLIGGLAVAMHRIPRATLDFDLAVYTADIDRTLSVLLGRGFGVMAMTPGRADPVILKKNSAIQKFLRTAKPRAVKVYHPEFDLAGDVWFEPTVPMARLLLRARRIRVENLSLNVASAEDLIRMKEAALADDPSRAQDRADIQALKHYPGKTGRP